MSIEIGQDTPLDPTTASPNPKQLEGSPPISAAAERLIWGYFPGSQVPDVSALTPDQLARIIDGVVSYYLELTDLQPARRATAHRTRYGELLEHAQGLSDQEIADRRGKSPVSIIQARSRLSRRLTAAPHHMGRLRQIIGDATGVDAQALPLYSRTDLIGQNQERHGRSHQAATTAGKVAIGSTMFSDPLYRTLPEGAPWPVKESSSEALVEAVKPFWPKKVVQSYSDFLYGADGERLEPFQDRLRGILDRHQPGQPLPGSLSDLLVPEWRLLSRASGLVVGVEGRPLTISQLTAYAATLSQFHEGPWVYKLLSSGVTKVTKLERGSSQ